MTRIIEREYMKENYGKRIIERDEMTYESHNREYLKENT